MQGHRDYIVKVLLNGLSGPVAGKTYADVMVPMGAGSTDEWVAGVASYVRANFGNNGSLVTPADVARVRAATAARKTPWTVAELEATLPRVVDPQTLKLSASHGEDTAANAPSLRGWSSGVPQASGMWFQIELAQPTLVTELQFDSVNAPGAGRGGGGGGGRGAAQAAGAAAPGQGAPAAAPGQAPAAGAAGRGAGGFGQQAVVTYPRGYSVQTSADGKTWSKPVAEGKGDGVRTTITFTPARAKFVRITQTETVSDAPSWSVSNLRVYEAPSASK